MFIHSSNEHLLSNAIVYATSLLPNSSVPPVLVPAVFVACGLAGVVGMYCENRLRGEQWSDQYGFGVPVLRRAVASVHRAVVERVPCCGGSAGVYGLMGFSCAAADNFLPMLTLLAYEICQLYNYTPQLKVFTESRVYIGHSAHLAGALCGMALGWLWRRWRQRSARRRYMWEA
jgi:membrane associated rhomboid family serine protease